MCLPCSQGLLIYVRGFAMTRSKTLEPAINGPFASSGELALELGATPSEAKAHHAKLERLAGAKLKKIMKLRCRERHCDWRGLENELLLEPNPFDRNDALTGCPDCKGVDTTQEACDEPECWEFSSCGTPTENGYRRTCHKHLPKEKP